jgi:hypothetical protein
MYKATTFDFTSDVISLTVSQNKFVLRRRTILEFDCKCIIQNLHGSIYQKERIYP